MIALSYLCWGYLLLPFCCSLDDVFIGRGTSHTEQRLANRTALDDTLDDAQLLQRIDNVNKYIGCIRKSSE